MNRIVVGFRCSHDKLTLGKTPHGRRGLSRLLLGSVTDKVVRGSSLPVLVCRFPEKNTTPAS